MSQVPPTAISSTNFDAILTAALQAYNKQTKKDIATHPLAVQLQSYDSPNAILTVLRAQVRALDQYQSTDEKWTKWLDPTVNVLYAFSASLKDIAGPVSRETFGHPRTNFSHAQQIFPPAAAIFAGIGILLQVSTLFDPARAFCDPYFSGS